MNAMFVLAAVLMVLIGLVHSVLGERLIFRRMRRGGWIPTEGGKLIGEGHVRILWATWHGLTVFGWGMAAMIFWMALHPSAEAGWLLMQHIVAASALGTSALVLVGTKARHPGWIGLLAVALLVWLG